MECTPSILTGGLQQAAEVGGWAQPEHRSESQAHCSDEYDAPATLAVDFQTST